MPADLPYVDTSALAKIYLPELGSDAVEVYVQAYGQVLVSSLTVTEMRCLLARRRRAGQLSQTSEAQAYATFLNQIEQGHLIVLEVENRHFKESANMIGLLPGIALRTLDALHLAVATDCGLGRLATADNVMAAAGEGLGLVVDLF